MTSTKVIFIHDYYCYLTLLLFSIAHYHHHTYAIAAQYENERHLSYSVKFYSSNPILFLLPLFFYILFYASYISKIFRFLCIFYFFCYPIFLNFSSSYSIYNSPTSTTVQPNIIGLYYYCTY